MFVPGCDHRTNVVAAASAIGALADGDRSLQTKLAVEIPWMLEQLQNPMPGLPWRIAALINRLIQANTEVQEAVVAGGGLAVLVGMLSDDSTHGQAKAADVLRTLAAANPKTLESLLNLLHREGSTDCIPVFLRMMKGYDSSTKMNSIRLLALVAKAHPEIRERAVQAGCIPLLVEMLRNETISDAPARAAALLGELIVSNPHHQQAAIDAGGP